MLHIASHWLDMLVRLFFDSIDYYLTSITDKLDYYAPGWRMYLLSPFVLSFLILPLLVLIYTYLSALLLFVYRRRHSIMDAFHNHTVWEGYCRVITTFWSGHGWIWHGYEVVGLENIPDTGPALIIYYHGAIPIDLYYFIAHLYLEKGRMVKNVVDNFVFKLPGLNRLFLFWGSFPGPRSEVVRHLKEGELVSIAPGGVREALFSENYSLVWGKREGFAKAALEARAPIIPMFTENCREAFDYVRTGRKFFKHLYERTRLPFIPLYGGFPVKLRTYIGKPIPYDPSYTPVMLANKVHTTLSAMIDTHQSKSSGIFSGICLRFKTKNVVAPNAKKRMKKKKKHES